MNTFFCGFEHSQKQKDKGRSENMLHIISLKKEADIISFTHSRPNRISSVWVALLATEKKKKTHKNFHNQMLSLGERCLGRAHMGTKTHP